jgi:uncharacterized protein YjcR
VAVADLCRKHGLSSSTFHKWKARYGGPIDPDAVAPAKTGISASARRAALS